MIAAAVFNGFGWYGAVMAICLLASAFFSGSETALFTLTPAQRHEMRSSRHWPSRLAARLAGRPRTLLNTLLLGNMLVNIAFSAMAAVFALELESAGRAVWLVGTASVLPLLAVLLLGEVTPKLLALTVARRWAVISALPIDLLRRLFLPVLWLLDRGVVEPCTRILAPRSDPAATDITAEELAGLMRLGARRGVLDHDVSDMLREIIELTDVTAGDIMVPRVDVVAYDVAKSPAGLIELFRETGFRKIPVYRDNLDDVLGVVHAKRLLLHPETPLERLVRPVSFLPEAANLEKVLAQFRKTRRQMAVVVDEYGGTAGLITLEDVLEEIVGDIPDYREAPARPPVQKLSPTQYLVSGDLSIRDWAEAFGLAPVRGRVSTIGGLAAALLNRIPREGDSAVYHNLRLTVHAMRRRRVEAVRVEWTCLPAGKVGGQP
ncbi:MAG: HlyC/CorC family transporter [Phycisphaerae bacterium]|nr:HlyC/CorC family transporter [Phycisphaerae bacterium]